MAKDTAKNKKSDTKGKENSLDMAAGNGADVEKKRELIKEYRTVYSGGVGELIEKKSRFIATVKPVETEEEAVAFIEELKKKYWDATHNCSAFVLGTRGEVTRCSDDGEPSGTAGRPMLDVLMGGGVRNVCVVVTRYFGGTLLGTGGLVRAYSASVQEGLKQCILIDKKLARQIKLTSDYSDVGKLQYLIAGRGYTTLNSEFTDHVEITVLVPVDDQRAFEKQITEATAGRTGWEAMDETYYAVAEGEILLFDH